MFCIYKPQIKAWPDKKGSVFQFSIQQKGKHYTLKVTAAQQAQKFTGQPGEKIYDYENGINMLVNANEAASLLACLRSAWENQTQFTKLPKVELLHDSGKASEELTGIKTSLTLSQPSEKFTNFGVRIQKKTADGQQLAINSWLDVGEAIQLELLLEEFLRLRVRGSVYVR